ncbi:MAG: uracil-DNA glycosylase [Bauldia sp.]
MQNPADHPPEAAALVAWYAAMGVDVALDESPVDRLAVPSPKPPPSPTPVPTLDAGQRAPTTASPLRAHSRPPVAVAPSDEAAQAAKTSARAATNLEELREALLRFEGCNLRLTATQLVFADGTPGSRVMFVGEAPGREEDMQGVPFVGRSGQLLDRMLAAIGLSRQSVYIANVVPWRPPGNRTPTPQETAICRPFVERQIELANPDFLVLLGGASAKELLGSAEGILRLRGQWRDFDTGARTIKAMATLHPAYLLRRPLEKRLAWRDFMALKKALDA